MVLCRIGAVTPTAAEERFHRITPGGAGYGDWR